MYIAFEKLKGIAHYTLRTSLTIKGELTFKEIFDLGNDPSAFIHYAGPNAFYFDEQLEEAVVDTEYSGDELEDLLWPWIKKEVRDAVEGFKNRSYKKTFHKLTDQQKQKINTTIHSFDKRRAHFLKFGTMDQGSVENMPPALFKIFLDCSRDEIEQWFMQQEFTLNGHDLKSYVYTVFDLQHFFQSFLAKKMPHALDPVKVDTFFIKELCRLNKELFNLSTALHTYMIRYAIMFFDYGYADTTLLDDFAKAFMNGQRVFKSKPKNPISVQKALELFSLSPQKFKTTTKQKLTRIYRKLARRVHPDTGGSDEKFVELNDAFNQLKEKIKNK
jgi:hypothetical protein